MTTIAPEYADFVRSRFKFLPDLEPLGHPPTDELVLYTSSASLMHCAVGLSGEAAELLIASSRGNCSEELGDFEFYLQAAKIVTVMDEDDPHFQPIAMRLLACGDGIWGFHGLLTMAHAFQDHAKKEWAYSKPRNRPLLHTLIWNMEEQLALLYPFLGLSRDDVIAANIGKLLKRYPAGYTDAAAQARADKPEGE